MDQAAIKRSVERRRVVTTKFVTEAEFQDVEAILMILKRLLPVEEVSVALMERMAIAHLWVSASHTDLRAVALSG